MPIRAKNPPAAPTPIATPRARTRPAPVASPPPTIVSHVFELFIDDAVPLYEAAKAVQGSDDGLCVEGAVDLGACLKALMAYNVAEIIKASRCRSGNVGTYLEPGA